MWSDFDLAKFWNSTFAVDQINKLLPGRRTWAWFVPLKLKFHVGNGWKWRSMLTQDFATPLYFSLVLEVIPPINMQGLLVGGWHYIFSLTWLEGFSRKMRSVAVFDSNAALPLPPDHCSDVGDDWSIINYLQATYQHSANSMLHSWWHPHYLSTVQCCIPHFSGSELPVQQWTWVDLG